MVLFLLVLHIMVESLFNSYSVSTYKKCRYIYSHFGVFIFKIMVAILRVLYFAAERRTRKKQQSHMVLFLLVLHIMVESLFNSYSVSTYKKCRYIYSHFGVFIFKIMVAILRVLYFAAERRTRKKQKTLHFYLCFPYHTKPYHTIPYHRLRTKIAFRHG